MRRGSGSYRDDVVDPPAVETIGGSGDDRAPVESAAIGGDGGFSLRQAMAWDAFSGKPECINDISEFLEELDNNPRLRSSANLRTLSRVRQELERIPESASLSDPIELRLQDVLVLMNQLMARMR